MKLFFQKRAIPSTTRKSLKEPSDQAKFIQQITHDMQGDFFVLTSACLLPKRQVEKKEDPIPLIDHLPENCQLYKYKLSNFMTFDPKDMYILVMNQHKHDVVAFGRFGNEQTRA